MFSSGYSGWQTVSAAVGPDGGGLDQPASTSEEPDRGSSQTENPEANAESLYRNFCSSEISRSPDLERFASHHNLTLRENKPLLKGDTPSHFIHGRNGYVMETNTPRRLQAGIMYLSTWERVKTEFRLSYHHCRILPPLYPELGDDHCIRVEFSPDNERQAKLIVELTGLE